MENSNSKLLPKKQNIPRPLNLCELPIQYEDLQYIARGSYGLVYSAFDKTCNQRVAIKKLDFIFRSTSSAVRAYREIVLATVLSDHPQFIRLRSIIKPTQSKQHFDSLILVFDFAESNLQQLIHTHSNGNQVMPECAVKLLMYQSVVGLKHLHSLGFAHRDIKPQNILVESTNLLLRFCDFGLGRAFTEQTNLVQTLSKKPAVISNHCCASIQRSNSFAQLTNYHKKRDLFVKSQFPVVSDVEEAKLFLKMSSSVFANTNYTSTSTTKVLTVPALKSSTLSSSSSPSLSSSDCANTKSFHFFTKHVATRFYRAPEIILLSSKLSEHSAASDVWSLGTIFAELIQAMMPAHSPNPLFPGKSCFPMTFDAQISDQEILNSPQDQLNLIFDVIGTPNDQELESVDNMDSRNYLKSLTKRSKVSWRKQLVKNDETKLDSIDRALDLLDKMLQFDPRKRITADQALKHCYFSDDTEDFREKLSKIAEASNSVEYTPKSFRVTETLQRYYQFERELEFQKTIAEHMVKFKCNQSADWKQTEHELKQIQVFQNERMLKPFNFAVLRDLIFEQVQHFSPQNIPRGESQPNTDTNQTSVLANNKDNKDLANTVKFK